MIFYDATVDKTLVGPTDSFTLWDAFNRSFQLVYVLFLIKMQLSMLYIDADEILLVVLENLYNLHSKLMTTGLYFLLDWMLV